LEPEYLKQWTIHELKVKSTLRLANLTNRRAIGFGVTNELSDTTPYSVAQLYAEVFDEARSRRGSRRFHGIRYRTRFDPGPVARGVAFFDDHGERIWESKQIEVDDEIVAQLKKLRVAVVPPLLSDLDEAAAESTPSPGVHV
jgi:hypothetical protein